MEAILEQPQRAEAAQPAAEALQSAPPEGRARLTVAERRQNRRSIFRKSLVLVSVARKGFARRRALREARSSGQVIGSADLVVEILGAGGGVVVDYLVRCRGGQADEPAARLAKVLNAQKLTDLRGYDFASTMICRDSIRNQIMEGVTRESKAKGLFGAVRTADFRRWAGHIRKCKREALCLGLEVQSLIARRKLLSTHRHVVDETAVERQGRAEEFWAAFRDRSRIVNRKPCELSARGEGAGGPKYGMRWDLASCGPRWQVLNPGPGTLAASLRPRGGREEGKHLGIGARTRSLPDLLVKDKRAAAKLMGDMPRPGPGAGPRKLELPPILQRRHRYLQECDEQQKVPTPLTFTTGHSTRLSAVGQNLVDKELLTLAGMVEEMPRVEEVDLGGNALLTDAGLGRFLQQLSREEVLASLGRLGLGGCVRAGPTTLGAVGALLKAGSGALRSLDLSRVQISTRSQPALANAIGRHPALQIVGLAEIGFLPSEQTKQCLTSILGSRTLHTLDLSWNCFDGDVFKSLGENVVRSHVLQTLRVANCAASTDVCSATDFVPPLSRFLETLSHNRSLTMLDISVNRCDFRTALILEDSLDSHRRLRELDLSENPLGVLGLRSILRLLSRDHTGLVFFNTDGCYGGGAASAVGLDTPTFSYTNPGGRYVLQLWRPYHRALLRMLYKTTADFGLKPEEAFENIAYKRGLAVQPWSHAARDDVGVWQVPEEGDLTLTLSVERAIFKRFMQAGSRSIEDADNGGFLERYYQEVRFRPGFKKVIPLFARWAELEGNAVGQTVFIHALSKDFSLTLPQLQHLCGAFPARSTEVLWRLRPCVPGDAGSQYLSSRLFRRLADLLSTHQLMLQLLSFNVVNPTGHYKLDLANCSDYAVAERLLLLDRWEAAVDLKHERKDVSQRGNQSHLRHEAYQGRSLHLEYHAVAEWKLPEQGEFECDFTSNQRPPKGAEVLTDKLWETVLVEMYGSIATPQDRIAALRSVSHNFWIRASHLRAMLGYFKTEQERADVFIIFYLRVVDLHNAKLFRVRFEKHEELVALQDRLGHASFFPFFQPENARFELDLAVYDQRLCAAMFVQLAIKEKFPHNLHDYGYKRADGTEDPMALGVPKSWGDFATIPKEGLFRATYMCAPEFRNFAHRKDIAATYGFLNGAEAVTEEDVQWWTGLTEPPEDVIHLLEYFIGRFDNVEQAFKQIDGADGNGSITLREFTEGLAALGCQKFEAKKGQVEGRTREQRLDAVFRYLDPGAEGTVSHEEWKVLGQLWSELDLSIKEFVHFLMLTFGDDLLDAWEALDTDDSGEMSEQEWFTAVADIGYFGPARVVFALLDSSDDGSISFDEFEVLEKYKPAKYKGGGS